MFLVLIFSRGWVDPGAMVRSEGHMSLKNPVTPPGIDPGTARLVAQRLNHYAAPGPILKLINLAFPQQELSHYGCSVLCYTCLAAPKYWEKCRRSAGQTSPITDVAIMFDPPPPKKKKSFRIIVEQIMMILRGKFRNYFLRIFGWCGSLSDLSILLCNQYSIYVLR
jgi:hypothetical protein